MNKKSIAGSVFVLAACSLAACGEDTPPGDNQAGGSAGTSGGKAGSGTAGNVSAGTSGSTAAGGTSAGTSSGSGGSVSAGTSGGPSAGSGGTPSAGTGAGAVGGSGGTPSAGTGGDGTSGTGVGGTGGDAAGGTGNTVDVTVQLADVRQLIRGFGINNNWAAIGSDADRLFGDGPGQLDLNILRVGMGPDGNPYNGSSCYTDIDAAVQRGAQYIIGTLWSPPGNMKINRDGTPHNDVADGGHLDPDFYEQWSDTIAAFPGKIEANTGTTLYAMSPQNEADFASCGREEPCNGNYDTTVMTGAEAVAFQKIVGPKLRAAGTIPMSPEASEWIHVWSNESASGSEPGNLPSSDPLNCGFPPTACPKGAPFDDGYEYGYALHSDPAAWAAFDIMSTHQYDTQVGMPWPADVPQGDKEVWQTEMSGVKWWPEQGTITAASGEPGGYRIEPTTHIQNGVAVARWVHSGLVDGSANAWLYWWYKAIDTDDNEGLVTKGGQIAKRFYTFGQFTRYVRPDYHRVNMTGAFPDKVLFSAYKGDGAEVVIVAINETMEAKTIPITIAGGTAPAMFTPYVTSASDDIAAKAAVAVTGGKFDAALPAMSVTTYVSM